MFPIKRNIFRYTGIKYNNTLQGEPVFGLIGNNKIRDFRLIGSTEIFAFRPIGNNILFRIRRKSKISLNNCLLDKNIKFRCFLLDGN